MKTKGLKRAMTAVLLLQFAIAGMQAQSDVKASNCVVKKGSENCLNATNYDLDIIKNEGTIVIGKGTNVNLFGFLENKGDIHVFGNLKGYPNQIRNIGRIIVHEEGRCDLLTDDFKGKSPVKAGKENNADSINVYWLNYRNVKNKKHKGTPATQVKTLVRL